eukprot:Clim_evm63s199 gene=Clim_evmTU63s199
MNFDLLLEKNCKNIRDVASTLKCSVGTVANAIQDNHVQLRTVRSTIDLTPQQKLDRLQYCLDHVDEDNRILDNDNEIHTDEKWFRGSKRVQRRYLPAGTDLKKDVKMKNKLHGIQIMYITAIAKPRQVKTSTLCSRGLKERVTRFDGKIGLFPCVIEKPAKRNSRNRPAGTMELHNRSLTKEVYAEFVSTTLIPNIVSKWPSDWNNERPIIIVHDNARPHLIGACQNVKDAIAWAKAERGLQIIFAPQPSKSPDMNANDCGFYRSIDASRTKPYAGCLAHAVENVTADWHLYDGNKLVNIFDTVRLNYEVVIRNGGHIAPRMEHTYKDMNRRHGSYDKLFMVSESDLQAAAKMMQELKQQVAALEQRDKELRQEVSVLKQQDKELRQEFSVLKEREKRRSEDLLVLEEAQVEFEKRLSDLEGHQPPRTDSTNHVKRLDFG